MDADSVPVGELEEIIGAVTPGAVVARVDAAWGGYDTPWGTRNRSYRCTLEGGLRLFVKEYGDSGVPDEILSRHVEVQALVAEGLARFSERHGFGPRAPLVLPRAGAPAERRFDLLRSTAGRRYSVFEFLPYRFCSWGETEGVALDATARGVARIHRALSDSAILQIPRLGAELVNSYPLARIRRALAEGVAIPESSELSRRIFRAAERFEQVFPEPLYDALPISTIHGDLAPIHLAFEERGSEPELAAVIDWERCCRGTRLWDFTRLLFRSTRWTPAGTVPMPDEPARFLEAYAREAERLGMPLGDDERRAYPCVVMLFHFRAIEEYLTAGGGEPGRLWMERNVEALECLLGAPVGVPGGDRRGLDSWWTETSDDRIELGCDGSSGFTVRAAFSGPADGAFGALYIPRALLPGGTDATLIRFEHVLSEGLGSGRAFALELRRGHAVRVVRTVEFAPGEESFDFPIPAEVGAWDELGLVFSASLNGLRRFSARLRIE